MFTNLVFLPLPLKIDTYVHLWINITQIHTLFEFILIKSCLKY